MGAASNGRERVVDLLLQHGADINVQESNGGTALMFAVSNGHERVVELLLRAGASAKARSVAGETALQMAMREGHAGCIRLLIEEQGKQGTAPASSRQRGVDVAEQGATRRGDKLALAFGGTAIFVLILPAVRTYLRRSGRGPRARQRRLRRPRRRRWTVREHATSLLTSGKRLLLLVPTDEEWPVTLKVATAVVLAWSAAVALGVGCLDWRLRWMAGCFAVWTIREIAHLNPFMRLEQLLVDIAGLRHDRRSPRLAEGAAVSAVEEAAGGQCAAGASEKVSAVAAESTRHGDSLLLDDLSTWAPAATDRHCVQRPASHVHDAGGPRQAGVPSTTAQRMSRPEPVSSAAAPVVAPGPTTAEAAELEVLPDLLCPITGEAIPVTESQPAASHSSTRE